MQREKLKCKNLHEYMRSLSPAILDKLYNHPATCLAVFRELPALAQNYVMRLLFLDQPVPQAAVAFWVKKDNQRDHDDCMSILMGLRLWHSQQLPGGLQGLVLNPIFKENLRIALLGGEGSEAPCITSAGFQFLLLDTCSQLWYFMLQYLHTAESRNMDLVEILSFVFQLSFSTLGKDYSVEGMSDSLLTFLQHLREFGLVFQRKRKSRRFYPTRLAINLASGVSGNSVDVHRQGYIIVETNYRIYAYTDSELQLALIALFSEMLYRFPNMVVAQLSRESVQQSIANGITAEQIIHFLRTRSHAVMMKENPVLPPTITDQIRLWELERDRLRFTEGVLYNQFLSQVDFELLRNYARDLGVLVWENPSKRLMVVTPGGHPDVRRFWKRQKHS
ncbi:general transcription factor IIH subunit 4 isoform X2 [Heterodontus francisci]|uniref:general transcription factor IIH subunit 4 isoform X2 n=1 Tax=Heterodontus francisci TaxID=7792 RepID=UPI00355AF750